MKCQWAQLEQTVGTLIECLANVQWAVVEAQPAAEPGHVLVDHFETAVTDILGLLKQNPAAWQADSNLPTLQRLLACLEMMVRVNGRFQEQCDTYEAIAPLYALADEREGDWALWVEGVLDALAPCAPAIQGVFEALLVCWQESCLVTPMTLAEPLSTNKSTLYAEVNNV